ncbi:MAG: signal peptidase I [Candidatus Berkelbacteria bacterium]|nr:signal peptidase I [Candidatus Berkelbacteria bacterium]
MMKKNNYWNILTCIIYAVVIIFAFLAISSKFSIGGIKLLVVKSGSMEPTIKTGSMVITESQADYTIDDIVTFKNREKPEETTTHRIVNEEYQGNLKLFITEGDANGSPDSNKVLPDQIVGKVIFKIPYFGYAVAFSRTLPGLIILIVIPATIIIYDEINKIKDEIKKRRKIKEQRGNKVDENEK